MTSTPSIEELVDAVTKFGSYSRPDRTFAAFRDATGPEPDLALAVRRQALPKWLNVWGCRIRYPREGEDALFDTNG